MGKIYIYFSDRNILMFSIFISFLFVNDVFMLAGYSYGPLYMHNGSVWGLFLFVISARGLSIFLSGIVKCMLNIATRFIN